MSVLFLLVTKEIVVMVMRTGWAGGLFVLTVSVCQGVEDWFRKLVDCVFSEEECSEGLASLRAAIHGMCCLDSTMEM